MAEEQEQAPEAQGGAGKALFWKVGVVVGTVLIMMTAALLVFTLVVNPRLQGGPEDPIPGPDEPNQSKIPATAVMVDFDEAIVAAVMSDPNLPTSMLLYQISLECSNQTTAGIVARGKAHFIDMLGELHRGRTREELEDGGVRDGIRSLALQKSNELLRRLQTQEEDEAEAKAGVRNRVTAVLYIQFTLTDM